MDILLHQPSKRRKTRNSLLLSHELGGDICFQTINSCIDCCQFHAGILLADRRRSILHPGNYTLQDEKDKLHTRCLAFICIGRLYLSCLLHLADCPHSIKQDIISFPETQFLPLIIRQIKYYQDLSPTPGDW